VNAQLGASVKPGDIVTDEPPIGSVVKDCGGTRHVRIAGGWCCCSQGDRCSTSSAWATVRINDPLTLISAPEPAPAVEEWETVTAEQVRVGDHIEVVQRTENGEQATRGVVERGLSIHGDLQVSGFHVSTLGAGTTIRRRVRTPMPEPGPGAVWECARKRYYNTGARDYEGSYIWVTPGDPGGSYNWADVQSAGAPTEVLAAVDLGGDA
jgi:hypothetical protein